MKHTYKRWFGSPYTVVILSLVLTVLIYLVGMLQARLMKEIGTLIDKGGTIYTIEITLAMWIGLYVAQKITYFVFSHHIYATITTELYEKLKRIEDSILASYGSGNIHTIVNNDVNTVMKLFLDYPSHLIGSTGIILYILYQIRHYTLPLAILILVGIGYGVFGLYASMEARKIYVESREVFRRKHNLTSTIVRGSSFMKVSVPEKFFSRQIRDIITLYRKRILRWAILSSTKNVVFNICVVSTSIWIAYLIRPYSPQMAIAMLGITPLWWKHVDSIVITVMGIHKSLEAYRHIENIWKEKEQTGHMLSLPITAKRLKTPYGKHFPISISLTPGSMTVITGPNGIGKTSLIKALLGTTTWYGHISTGKHRVYYLPQETVIFPATIYENIVMGKDIDKRQLITVAKELKLDTILPPP